jgi:hypothetical protein
MKRWCPSVTIATFVFVVLFSATNMARGDHGPGVPIDHYVPQDQDEEAIVRLIRTVGMGWERKEVDAVMEAYAPDAVQRAWNDPTRMLDYSGIRREALGAFRDPQIGRIRFEDWIHRIYIVNASAIVEVNQKFHGWGRDHYYRDFWMFSRRAGRWRLVRYDYEVQPPFDVR